jgi:hypothetical protein
MTAAPRRLYVPRGTKNPPNTKLVARTSRYGNPYAVEDYGLDEALRLYAAWIVNPDSQPILYKKTWYYPKTVEQIRADLRGWNLACRCEPGERCHADLLLELANR